eukprot:Tamp_20135.p1 GENE.Tamp_20135~~Tamp_20135.p1  ORF type:complete len:299 (+),score=76.34 Tamp_20135:65-898(+)
MPEPGLEEKVVEDVRTKCFFDISHGGGKVERIVFELFDDLVPKTAENFRQLCIGSHVSKSGKKLHYKGNCFHRVIGGFMMQGGDITKGDGTGGESIYGVSFPDEGGYAIKHTSPGLLSMANCGKHTNNSQFFITFKAAPWLDGKHVVFGRVIEGIDAVMEYGRCKTGTNDRPSLQILIKDCGEMVDEAQRILMEEQRKQEEREEGKTEVEKAHQRVRIERAKVEAESSAVQEEVSAAVQAGMKRQTATSSTSVQAKKPKLGAMFDALDEDDSDCSDA